GRQTVAECCRLTRQLLRAFYQRGGQAWLHAGAGLVAPSTPEREFRETCEKLQSVSLHLIPMETDRRGDAGRKAERTCA
ncbi:MAG: hypothetical protein F8N37_00280, partial [Telmatospirillum sp.]|nr:hypothetical protein [Telmatospirillum sp.]